MYGHLQDKLNKAVSALFAEAQYPDSPTEYIAAKLCAEKLSKADASLKRVQELEREVKKLKTELRDLKK